MDLDTRQLRYFITVAEHLSFTEAANKLFIAQSAVSQQIADLEEKVGVKLFIRSKRSVQLTPAGAVFLQEATKILNRAAEAIDKARQTESGVIGSLSIGFLATHVRSFLPDVIKRFRELYPKVELNLNHYPSKMLKEALESKEFDIGFTSPAGLHRIEGIQIQPILKDPYCIVTHKNHPLASQSSIKLSDLSDEPFIIHNRHDSPIGSYDYIVKLCESSGFIPRIVSQPRFVDTVLILVEAEIGIAVLPRSFKLMSDANLRFLEIETEEDKYFELVVAWKKMNVNPSIPIFLQVLSQLHPGFQPPAT
ncbi:LysR family transcriptional regulator [Ferviditalea candida]|uniref:LysR family transcriptional regulator n=1 Tax=Ferviditalea candida TaxID=3108399 RepID=A0ABU5ZQD7_9BACL|nr:LysR family transcriptional regulator [Paenibacillaceae bacterium T2]